MMQKINEQFSEIKSFLDKKFFVVLGKYFLFAGLFAFLSILLSRIKFLVRLDVLVQETVINLRIGSLNNFFITITDLGDTKAMIIWTLIVAALFFWKKRYIYSIGIVLSIGVSEFTAFLLKNTVERHRPPSFMALVSETSASFPSGHSIAAISFYGFLFYFFSKNIANRNLRYLLIFFCILMITLSGFIRIYLGAHWPSDVIASYILGLTWLLLIIPLINSRQPQSGLENKPL